MREALHDHTFDSVLSFGFGHALASIKPEYPKTRFVLDWIDSPSLHQFRIAEDLAMDPSKAVEATICWERRVNAQVDCALYISEADLRFANPDPDVNLEWLPNGLLDDFPESLSVEPPIVPRSQGQLTLGFLGNMGYEPNHKAAIRLCTEILPRVQRRLPSVDVRVKVIGRVPRSELRSLASESIEITGTVESIWEHLVSVDFAVFPMTRGAGMQNKVIEALRAGRPTIATPICAGGLPRFDESGVAVGNSSSEIAELCAGLFHDAQSARRLAAQGRRYAQSLSWPSICRSYEEVLPGT